MKEKIKNYEYAKSRVLSHWKMWVTLTVVVYDRNYLQFPFLNELKFRITAIMLHLLLFLIHYKIKIDNQVQTSWRNWKTCRLYLGMEHFNYKLSANTHIHKAGAFLILKILAHAFDKGIKHI